MNRRDPTWSSLSSGASVPSKSFGIAGNVSTSEGTEQILQESNTAKINELSDKVASMKRLSQSVYVEIQEHNALIDEIESGITDASSMLARTMAKLKQVGEAGGMKQMFYLIAFVVFVFLLLYYMIKFFG
eukprot:CAMPEP_0177653584 /NCGR_PEP_ID=MMETSP0447-20121125/13819_1 /TAXON_ID=0 /ORGANISM="Stygamoeba regulata, Strain BSH-02190019" /LENGTH=129 /DNA_ID=CAMNT_0019157061 /DNA_START=101 /DNA_END=490 /DNA_ORIENTATION=-